MRSISGSRIPRVVTAGLPRRMPPAVIGGVGSKGMAFLFTVMVARSSEACASLPVSPRECRSTRNRWLSVPPLTMRNPRRAMPAASALALATTCF